MRVFISRPLEEVFIVASVVLELIVPKRILPLLLGDVILLIVKIFVAFQPVIATLVLITSAFTAFGPLRVQLLVDSGAAELVLIVADHLPNLVIAPRTVHIC